MAEIQPLEAIRYAPDVDLSNVICPPFDIISPEEQRRLYKLSPHNAVRLELPESKDDPYQTAAKTLRQWLDKGTLVRDESPAFYVLQQEFRHGGETFRRRLLFCRLRLEPWDHGTVLPHEHTFSGPKEDRLKLLRSLRLNTSPIFLVYADQQQRIAPLIASAVSARPNLEFVDEDGLACHLLRIDDPHLSAAITRGLEKEKLYIADGHHRYETAMAYRDERLGGPPVARARDEAENFVLTGLAAVDDPGLLVLPIHRLVAEGAPLERTLTALSPLFEVETRPALTDLMRDMDDRGRTVNRFGLIAAESPDFFLLTLTDPEAAERFLPGQRPPIWRRLDAAIATHVILRRALGLSDDQIGDKHNVWYGENADAALAEVRQGRARYAVLLNPVSPRRILAVADAGERMPQKSTFFYPKIPTGLLFNPLFGP